MQHCYVYEIMQIDISVFELFGHSFMYGVSEAQVVSNETFILIGLTGSRVHWEAHA